MAMPPTRKPYHCNLDQVRVKEIEISTGLGLGFSRFPGEVRQALAARSQFQPLDSRLSELRELRTNRLVLHQLSLANAQSLLRPTLQEPELFRFLALDVRVPTALDTWLMKALLSQSRGEAVHFMMSLATTGTPIGHTAVIAIRNEHRRCEIGWSWIFKDYQRQGYALETKLAFYTLLFQHGYRRVQITADARNHASIRSIEASGARFEGELEDVQFLADGTFRNTVVYRMLRHEWAPGTVCLG